MGGFKHTLKQSLRGGFARLFALRPVWHLVDRLAPRRMLILFGHCVDDTLYDGVLTPDMCLSQARFVEVVDALRARGAELGTIGSRWDQLQAGSGARSQVAISMDDGYHDNARVMTPLLAARGLGATVFLETRALDERRVNWTHHLHWLFDARGGEAASRGLVERARAWEAAPLDGAQAVAEPGSGEALAGVVEEALALGTNAYYHVKRRLKYDVAPRLRDGLLAAEFAAHGGDEASLANHLYMTWDEARAMASSGVEVGGHTVSHAILSTLGAEAQASEVRGSLDAIEAALEERPRVFAYPFGRRWDYDADSVAAVRSAGCELAVNTHSGTNPKDAPPYELRRVPVQEDTPLHLLLAEASGGFLLLEKLGLSLSE